MTETQHPSPEDIQSRGNTESEISMNAIAETIKDDLDREMMVPVQLIQGGGVVDFIDPRTAETKLNESPNTGEYERLEQILETDKRRFSIILAIYPQEREVILKSRTQAYPEFSTRNEIDFLKSISPIIINEMSSEGSNLGEKNELPCGKPQGIITMQTFAIGYHLACYLVP